MTDFTKAIAETEQQGFAIIPDYITKHTLDILSREYERVETGEASLGNLLKRSNVVSEMAFDSRTLGLVKSIIGDDAIPVTAFFLNKTQEKNWQLPWHQDTKVAVQAFHETEGYAGWTSESGIMHVIPPPPILEYSLTLRFNMDDSDEANGGLQVLPGTHREGILSNENLAFKIKTIAPVLCASSAGSLTLLKALTVHQSGASQSSRSRRLLQLEYCGKKLHGDLKFYDVLSAGVSQ